jgi:hypothetical protein
MQLIEHQEAINKRPQSGSQRQQSRIGSPGVISSRVPHHPAYGFDFVHAVRLCWIFMPPQRPGRSCQELLVPPANGCLARIAQSNSDSSASSLCDSVSPDAPGRERLPTRAVDRVEERFQVAFHGVAATFLPAGCHFGHRHVGGAAGPVTVHAIKERQGISPSKNLSPGVLAVKFVPTTANSRWGQSR